MKPLIYLLLVWPMLLQAASPLIVWQDNADNETRYEVERAPANGFYQLQKTLPANSTWFRDDSVTDGSWRYRVFAVNSAGRSPASNEILVTIRGHLINLSTRGWVEAGERILIGGFVVQPGSSARVLIRGVGPTLALYGVTAPLIDPSLRLVRQNPDGTATVIATNDQWGNDPGVSSAAVAVSAFPLEADSSDAALVVTLPPGSYTALVEGAPSSSGIALVEVYQIP